MLDSLTIDGRTFDLDGAKPIDISIPLNFNGPQPNAYEVQPATSEACESGDIVGDTRRGGSCNFERYTFIPHCNGTHTECVGHITHDRISIRECLKDVLIPATLITIAPCYASESDEHYSVAIDAADRLITRKLIESHRLLESPDDITPSKSALIVRTLPNDERKLARRYGDQIPPYFTTEAMESIADRGFKHLLVDLPSIDRLYDEGKLSNHRIFWKVENEKFEINQATRLQSTVTEMIYVPNAVEDGSYLMNLQIAPFASDASPSRPLLFRLKKN